MKTVSTYRPYARWFHDRQRPQNHSTPWNKIEWRKKRLAFLRDFFNGTLFINSTKTCMHDAFLAQRVYLQLNKTLSWELLNTRNIVMERLGQKHPLILTQKLNPELGSLMRKLKQIISKSFTYSLRSLTVLCIVTKHSLDWLEYLTEH